VDQGLLEAVIKLPSGSFECTNVAPIAIVLRGSEEKPRPNTLFVDASYLDIAKGSEKAIADFVSLIAQGEDCEFMRNVGPDEIAQNLFNLDPARYPITEEKRKISSYLARRETVALSEICEILRPQLLLESEAGGQEVREVAFADIQEDGFILRPAKTRRIAHDTFKRSSRFIIRPGDILLSVKGTVGRIGLIQEAFDDACIPSQSFVLLRLDSREQRLSATYLFYFLSSPFGQGQINACKSGSVISILQSSDIKELRVALPKPGEEHKVAQTHQKIEHLRSEVLAAQAQMVALRRELFESENNGGKAGPTG
jgi:type I restriction enzyme M protein